MTDRASHTYSNWASLVVRAHLRGRLSGAELWDILLAYMDDCFAPQIVARLLKHIDRVLVPEPPAYDKHCKLPRRPAPDTVRLRSDRQRPAGPVDPDLIVIGEDDNRELLSA